MPGSPLLSHHRRTPLSTQSFFCATGARGAPAARGDATRGTLPSVRRVAGGDAPRRLRPVLSPMDTPRGAPRDTGCLRRTQIRATPRRAPNDLGATDFGIELAAFLG